MFFTQQQQRFDGKIAFSTSLTTAAAGKVDSLDIEINIIIIM